MAILIVLSWVEAPLAQAQEPASDPLTEVGYDQRLDVQAPLDLEFVNEEGRPVQLRQFFGERPVILALGYYECPMLCPLIRDGFLTSIQKLDFNVGEEFTVLYISIDPNETPMMAAAQKEATIAQYNRPGAAENWHFLIGNQDAINQIAQAIGFRYVYDAKTDEYAHPSGIVILTPQGRIARYLYGIEYATRDLRLGLVEASENKIGSPVDQLLLLCYHYDPTTGKYNGLITNITQTLGILTVLTLAAAITMMMRHSRPGGAQQAPS